MASMVKNEPLPELLILEGLQGEQSVPGPTRHLLLNEPTCKVRCKSEKRSGYEDKNTLGQNSQNGLNHSPTNTDFTLPLVIQQVVAFSLRLHL